VNGIEAVRAYLVGHLGGCAVAPFSDALTHVHGTVGFSVVLGDTLRTVEVAYELLEPESLAQLHDYLDHVGLAELLRGIDDAAILVTPAGAHPIEVHAPRGGTPSGEIASSATPAIRAYLVVEDDPEVADAVDGYLRALGGTVCSVTRVEDAEKLLLDLCFDGIVVDLHLPDGDGLDWLARLPRSERGFGGRKIVCSGGALPDDRLDDLDRSGAVFLEKPYSLRSLAEALGLDVDPAA
jgi:CheY-like chemotaxis protein